MNFTIIFLILQIFSNKHFYIYHHNLKLSNNFNNSMIFNNKVLIITTIISTDDGSDGSSLSLRRSDIVDQHCRLSANDTVVIATTDDGNVLFTPFFNHCRCRNNGAEIKTSKSSTSYRYANNNFRYYQHRSLKKKLI